MHFQHASEIWRDYPELSAGALFADGVRADVEVDGAGKLRQIWHITLPGLRPVMAVLLVLSLGNLLDAGFDQVFQLYNGAVLEVADIIDTYVYRVGLLDAQFELATAVGLFKGVVGLVMILTANFVLRRMGQRSIW